MNIATILSLAAWPLIALGAALLFALSRLPKSSRWNNDAALWIGILCIGTPTFLVVFIYHDGSQVLAFDADVFFIMIGAAVLATMRNPDLGQKSAVATLGGLMGVGLMALGGWYLVGDFLLHRVPVTGTVASTRASHSKAGLSYHVVVDGRHHTITGDLFETVRPGDRIDAQAGQASGTIFSLTR